jgi:hypothetical protein
MKKFLVFLTGVLVSSCSIVSPSSNTDHDAQFIQIFYHSGLLDELDTFHGTYQKDLIPGAARTTMWLTSREQEMILDKVERFGFFSFPDTIHRPPNQAVSPDFGPQVIRMKYKDQDKTIVWYYPISSKSKFKYYIEGIQELLNDIIVSKPEYKALPPAKGGYQ